MTRGYGASRRGQADPLPFLLHQSPARYNAGMSYRVITKTRIWVASLVLMVAALAWACRPTGFDAWGSVYRISDFESTSDGTRIVTSDDSGIRVWDVESHQLRLRVPFSADRSFVAVSPDCRLIAVRHPESLQEVRLLDLDNGQLVKDVHIPKVSPNKRDDGGYDDYVSALAFGSESKTLIVGVGVFRSSIDDSPDYGVLCRVDLSSNESRWLPKIDLPEVPETVRLFPDGKLAAVVGQYKMAVVVDLENNHIRHDVSKPFADDDAEGGKTIYAVDVSPNGQLLAIGDTPGRLRIVNAVTAEDVHVIVKPDSTLWGPLRARFSPDGAFLAVAWAPTPCTVYDTRTWNIHSEFACNMYLSWIPKQRKNTLLYFPGSGDGDIYPVSWRKRGTLQLVAFDQLPE